MINKAEILTIVDQYSNHLEKDFKFSLHVEAHPLLKQAAKARERVKYMDCLVFSNEFLTWGQALPRASGKTTTLKEVAELLIKNSFKDLLPNYSNKDSYMLYNNTTKKLIVLQGDLSIPKNKDRLKGLYLSVPPLRIVLHTPVISF